MLYYDRIDVSNGIDINNTSASKESNICHCWCFLEVLSFNWMFVMCAVMY